MELVACFSCAINKTQRNTKRCNSTGGAKTKTRSSCEYHNATRPKPFSATMAPFAFFASFYQLNAWKKPWNLIEGGERTCPTKNDQVLSSPKLSTEFDIRR